MQTGSAKSHIYEVLTYEASVELEDYDGRVAKYVKREHIRFLEDGGAVLVARDVTAEREALLSGAGTR